MVEIKNRVITTFEVQGNLANKNLDKMKAAADRARIATNALRMKNKEIRKVMAITGLTANQSAKAISQLGYSFDKSGRAVDALGKRMVITNGTMVEMQKTTRRFEMGFLSLMFASMALNRAVGGFLRNAITAYGKASGESSAFRKETNKLIASWEFFKFSIIDALTKSEVFAKLITLTTNLVNKFNSLTPAAKSFIALSLGFLFIISLLGMIIGQVGLAKGGFQVLGDVIKLVFSKDFIPLIGKAFMGFLKFTGSLILVIASFIFLKSLLFGFDKDMDAWLASWQRSGGTITKIILGIVRTLNFAGEFFRVAFLNWMDTLAMGLEWILNKMIKKINNLISAMNMIPGVSIPLIPKVDFGAFDRISERTLGLMAMTPALSDMFTGGKEPTKTTSTSIGEVNINIDGAGQDVSALADQIIEKLNVDVNAGLDSSNT